MSKQSIGCAVQLNAAQEQHPDFQVHRTHILATESVEPVQEGAQHLLPCDLLYVDYPKHINL